MSRQASMRPYVAGAGAGGVYVSFGWLGAG
jgi:hypothetical protein